MKKLLTISLLTAALIVTSSANAQHVSLTSQDQGIGRQGSAPESRSPTITFELTRTFTSQNFEKFSAQYTKNVAKTLRVKSNSLPFQPTFSKTQITWAWVNSDGKAQQGTFNVKNKHLALTFGPLKNKKMAKKLIKSWNNIPKNQRPLASAQLSPQAFLGTYFLEKEGSYQMSVRPARDFSVNRMRSAFQTTLDVMAETMGIETSMIPAAQSKQGNTITLTYFDLHTEATVVHSYNYVGSQLIIDTSVLDENSSQSITYQRAYDGLTHEQQATYVGWVPSVRFHSF